MKYKLITNCPKAIQKYRTEGSPIKLGGYFVNKEKKGLTVVNYLNQFGHLQQIEMFKLIIFWGFQVI